MHGATLSHVIRTRHASGLSPRARGNRDGLSARSLQRRSIPACTGQPSCRRTRRPSPAVYPRVHGATGDRLLLNEDGEGLSPRARGNQARAAAPERAERSIPACTGQPPCRQRPCRLRSVYPRVHGATAVILRADGTYHGLSPRARGNPAETDRRLRGNRSIPACTGQPVPCAASPNQNGVYPRVHGATNAVGTLTQGPTGLSPRARGNLVLPDPRALRCRSIPACTGQPSRACGPWPA